MTVSPTLTSTLNAAQPVHLWATGSIAAAIPEGTVVGDRFQVLAPRLWRDDQPQASLIQDSMPEQVKPYLKLYAHRLHVPEPYGVYTFSSGVESAQELTQAPTQKQATVLLLDNAPVDTNGNLLPSLESVWSQASSVRQLHWLWQMSQLWEPLATEHVAASLLYSENLRVRGWRLQLCELIADAEAVEPPQTKQPSTASLHTLGGLWMTWAETAHIEIQSTIRAIAEALRSPEATG